MEAVTVESFVDTQTIPVMRDAAVQCEAQNLLERSNYLALRRLQCEFREGKLVLTGRVPTYYLKQVAQTLVRHVPNVRRIDNRIDVAEFWN